MMKQILFFRGRNTANIIEDARNAGFLEEGDVVRVIASDDDPMRQEGDMSPDEVFFGVPTILVANGGTTGPQVKVVHLMAEECQDGYKIINLQREGAGVLVERFVTC